MGIPLRSDLTPTWSVLGLSHPQQGHWEQATQQERGLTPWGRLTGWGRGRAGRRLQPFLQLFCKQRTAPLPCMARLLLPAFTCLNASYSFARRCFSGLQHTQHTQGSASVTASHMLSTDTDACWLHACMHHSMLFKPWY